MDHSKILQSVLNGEMPDGMMLVATENGSSEIKFFGVNKVGCAIPLEMVETFIKDLELKCLDASTLYQFQAGETTLDIPGNRVSKIAMYLRQARDIGVMLGRYQQYL